jgi:hypothetical protein
MKKIAKLLKADFNESSDLASIAAMLASKGRGKDTLLVHITPREAQILKDLGGSGTTNPETGLLEFDPVDTPVSDFEAMPATQQEFAQAQQAAEPFSGGGIKAQTATVDPYSAQGRGTTLPADVTYETPVSGATTSYLGAGGGLTLPSIAGRQDYGVAPTTLPRGPSLVAEGQAATPITTPPPPEKPLFGLDNEKLIRLGLAGGLGVLGAQRARQGAGQVQAATQEQKALAQPYQTQGQELIRAAQAGELTPASQASLQATQARLAQGAESRGGVGAAQVAAQVETLRQQLLQNQYSYGLQVAQVGDSIALGAIKSGLQLDQALQQATGNFYTNLAMVAGGIPMARA